MKNLIAKSVLTAATSLVIGSTLIAAPAAAKIKEVKMHFVTNAFGNPPAMEMKYTGGKWTWINQNKSFQVQVKLKAKSSGARLRYGYLWVARVNGSSKTNIWEWPLNYKTYNYEKLVSRTIGKSILSKNVGSAAALCGTFGGNKKVVRDMYLPAAFQVHDTYQNSKAGFNKLNVKVVCHAKPQPTRKPPAAFSVSSLKLYTIPAKPACGKPVTLIAKVEANKPGKVGFTLYRKDGLHQKTSMNVHKQGSGYKGAWSKKYIHTKSVNLQYLVALHGHKKSTQWVPIKVNCGAKGGQVGGKFKS